MTLLCHLLILAVCTLACAEGLASFRRSFCKLLVFSGYGLIHGLVPAITPVDLLNRYYSEHSRYVAAAVALLGAVLLLAGWKLGERLFDTRSDAAPGQLLRSPAGQVFLQRLLLFSMVAGPTGWLLTVYAAGVGIAEHLESARFAFRGQSNRIVFTLGANLMGTLALPGFLAFFVPPLLKRTALVYALVSCPAMFVLMKGSRAAPLGILGSIVAGYVMTHRINVRRLPLIFVAGALALMLSVSLYKVRHMMGGQFSLQQAIETVFSTEVYRDALGRDPLNYHEMLVAVCEHFPRDHPFLEAATFRRIVFFALPSGSFPHLKPKDVNQIVADVVVGRYRQQSRWVEVTYPPTLPGECYVNYWGWTGMSVMCLYGILFAWILQRSRTSLIWFLVVMPNAVRFVFVGLRGQPYEICIAILFLLLLTWCLQRLLAPVEAPTGLPAAPRRPPLRRGSLRAPLSSQTTGA